MIPSEVDADRKSQRLKWSKSGFSLKKINKHFSNESYEAETRFYCSIVVGKKLKLWEKYEKFSCNKF